MAKKHRFQRYYERTGHYPTFRMKIGDPEKASHQLEVTITPTYITIRTTLYSDPIRIPRRQLVALIRWAIPLIRSMDRTVDFDPQRALSEQMRAEEAMKRDVKAVKAGRRGEAQEAHEAARARRYRAAQARSARRRSE